MKYLISLIFIASAFLEVSGDAIIRKGLRGGGILLILTGYATLAFYGVVVNTLKWNFSRLLGVYVSIFALAGVLFGRFAFHEKISLATWIGVSVFVIGGFIIKFGD